MFIRLKTKVLERPQTSIIILICIIIYLLDLVLFNFTSFRGEKLSWLFEWGKGSGLAVYNGAWWIFLTNGFLHLDLFHLVYNLWVLWILGGLNEKIIGIYYWLIYMLIQIQSNCVAFFLLPVSGAVGSSAAVMGVGGYFIARLFSAKDRSVALAGSNPFVIAFLVFSLGLGFMPDAKSLAFIVHISGFLIGIIYRLLELSLKRNKNKSTLFFSFITLIILAIFYKLPYIANNIFFRNALSCITKHQKSIEKNIRDSQSKKIAVCDLLAKNFERIPETFVNEINNCHQGKLEFCDLMERVYYAINKNEFAMKYLNIANTIRCEKNDYNACYRLGDDYSVLNDKENTIFYYGKACANKIVNACYKLGFFYFENNHYIEAVKVYKKGCELDHADSCTNLGFTYFKMNKDFEKQKKYATKGCLLGSYFGCYNNACNFCEERKKSEAIVEFKKFMNLMNEATTEELENALTDKSLDCIKNDQIWTEYLQMLKLRSKKYK